MKALVIILPNSSEPKKECEEKKRSMEKDKNEISVVQWQACANATASLESLKECA